MNLSQALDNAKQLERCGKFVKDRIKHNQDSHDNYSIIKSVILEKGDPVLETAITMCSNIDNVYAKAWILGTAYLLIKQGHK